MGYHANVKDIDMLLDLTHGAEADSIKLEVEAVGWDTEEQEGAFLRLTREGGKFTEEEEVLFERLAPLLVPGSYVEFIGEDFEMWRWDFRHGKLRVSEGFVAWVPWEKEK
jgi:hypothetical protein